MFDIPVDRKNSTSISPKPAANESPDLWKRISIARRVLILLLSIATCEPFWKTSHTLVSRIVFDATSLASQLAASPDRDNRVEGVVPC